MTRLTLCKSQLFVNETVKTTNINYQKKKTTENVQALRIGDDNAISSKFLKII